MDAFTEDVGLAPDQPPEEENQESGQGMVEYAFILVLIVLVLILIVTVVGKQTNNFYSNISNGLSA